MALPATGTGTGCGYGSNPATCPTAGNAPPKKRPRWQMSGRACSCPRGHHHDNVRCLITSDELRDQIASLSPARRQLAAAGPKNGERCEYKRCSTG